LKSALILKIPLWKSIPVEIFWSLGVEEFKNMDQQVLISSVNAVLSLREIYSDTTLI
jgi:hypothetical protein